MATNETRNALAQLLYELPSMINQLKMAEMSFEFQSKIREDEKELAFIKDSYNEAKSLSQHWKTEASRIEDTLLQTGVDLKDLPEEYQTSGGPNVTKNVGDNKASKCVLIPIKEIFNETFYKEGEK